MNSPIYYTLCRKFMFQHLLPGRWSDCQSDLRLAAYRGVTQQPMRTTSVLVFYRSNIRESILIIYRIDRNVIKRPLSYQH